MKKISAVIITYNEEKNLRRCLESLGNICDEILIVDSFSTDKTAEIAKSFNAKFIQHPFDGYIQQKNYALSLAKNDMVLSLDGDEALSPELLESIKKAFIHAWRPLSGYFKMCWFKPSLFIAV